MKYTDTQIDEILKDLAEVIAKQDALKFSEIFDDLEPRLVAELAEEAEKILQQHKVSTEGYDGAIAEFALMWLLLKNRQKQ